MRISMKKVAAVVAGMLAGMAVSVAGAQAAPSGAEDVSPFAWEDCRAGFSCYFQHAEGGTPMWVAPSAGCFDLSTLNPPFNDRITSIYNHGNGTVRVYNWVGSWQLLDTLPVGAKANYTADWRNDIIDRVCIA